MSKPSFSKLYQCNLMPERKKRLDKIMKFMRKYTEATTKDITNLVFKGAFKTRKTTMDDMRLLERLNMVSFGPNPHLSNGPPQWKLKEGDDD